MKPENRFENTYEHPSFFKSAFALGGSVTPRVIKLVLVAILYAGVISILHRYFLWVSIPVSPFEYAGLVMGLILVFRINAGYDRWWEARKLWGSVVNNSRNLGVILTTYYKTNNSIKTKEALGLITALPFLMKNHLRQEHSIEEVLQHLQPQLHEALREASHKPNFISKNIGSILNEATASRQLNHFAFLQAEQHRATLMDCQGACERILNTPMPVVMAIKSRRFILLFILMLPIALAEHSVYLNILVTTLVSYALLSLDQIGIELQNPFSKKNLSHLPLDNICKTIASNLEEFL